MTDFDNWLANANEHARQAGLQNEIDDTIKTVTDREHKAVCAARSYLSSKMFRNVEDVVGLKIREIHHDFERVVLVFTDGYYLCVESEYDTSGVRPVSLDTYDAEKLGLLPERLHTEIQEATADKNAKLKRLKAQQTLKVAIAELGQDEVRKVLDGS